MATRLELKDFLNLIDTGKPFPSSIELFVDNLEDTQLLANALESGKCPRGLVIHIGYRDMDAKIACMAHALQSGKCPEHLTLDFCDVVTQKGADALIEALQTKRCPKLLTIHYGAWPYGRWEKPSFGPNYYRYVDNSPQAIDALLTLMENHTPDFSGFRLRLTGADEQQNKTLALLYERINTQLANYLLMLNETRKQRVNSNLINRLPAEMVHTIFSSLFPGMTDSAFYLNGLLLQRDADAHYKEKEKRGRAIVMVLWIGVGMAILAAILLVTAAILALAAASPQIMGICAPIALILMVLGLLIGFIGREIIDSSYYDEIKRPEPFQTPIREGSKDRMEKSEEKISRAGFFSSTSPDISNTKNAPLADAGGSEKYTPAATHN